jgi:hypothetical protein
VSHSTRLFSLSALVATAALAGIAWRSAPSDPQQGAPPSVATVEHKLLEKYVGAWDAEVSMAGPPGQPAVKTPGKSTARLTGGGLWLVTDFEGSVMGMPFIGHEVFGYDTTLKQYVVNWVDSMSTGFSTGELAFDAKNHKLEGSFRGRDEKDAPMTWRQVEIWKDDDTREWTMYRKGADVKESVDLAITYKRHK